MACSKHGYKGKKDCAICGRNQGTTTEFLGLIVIVLIVTLLLKYWYVSLALFLLAWRLGKD